MKLSISSLVNSIVFSKELRITSSSLILVWKSFRVVWIVLQNSSSLIYCELSMLLNASELIWARTSKILQMNRGTTFAIWFICFIWNAEICLYGCLGRLLTVPALKYKRRTPILGDQMLIKAMLKPRTRLNWFVSWSFTSVMCSSLIGRSTS